MNAVSEPRVDECIVGSDVLSESFLTDVKGLAAVSCPGAHGFAQSVDLLVPLLDVAPKVIRPDDQQIDVARAVAVAARCAAEQRGMERLDVPPLEFLGQPDSQGKPKANKALQGRPSQVLTVGGIQDCVAVRLGEDDSLLYQPTQHELNAAVTPRTGQPMDLAPGQASRRAGEHLEHGRIEGRNKAADRVGYVHRPASGPCIEISPTDTILSIRLVK